MNDIYQIPSWQVKLEIGAVMSKSNLSKPNQCIVKKIADDNFLDDRLEACPD